MEKIVKQLNKRYDKKFYSSKNRKTKVKKMKACFDEYKLSLSFHTPFDYFVNEIIYQGIANKIAFESTYAQGKLLMHDYYGTLDYIEKQRLMNYEISQATKNIVCVEIDHQSIYIPFFDREMNHIYEQDIVRFDMPKYQYYIHRFDTIFQSILALYQMHFFIEDFCSATCIYKIDHNAALYCKETCTIYFISNFKYENHITLSKHIKLNELQHISHMYFENKEKELLQLFFEFDLIHNKDKKKYEKILRKVSI